MTSRNLTGVFVIMRNNACKNRSIYGGERQSEDAERLLQHSMREAEEGLELRDDYEIPPSWIDKLEEAQYTLSKIKPKLDELGSLHTRHLLRPTFDENCEEEIEVEQLSQEISKLISSTHRHIQCIRSSLGIGTKLEQRLTANVVTYLLLDLQDLSLKYRNSQNLYIGQLNLREERSQKYFSSNSFTNIDLNSETERENFVESFDNFLQQPSNATTTKLLYDEGSEQQIDEHFQRPVAHRMTQQQLLLFEEENTRMAAHREEEISNIGKTIFDLNDIFKDLSQMVQEQGTVLDRIDYNVEQTQTRVSEGLQQLQRAETYQRKNCKLCFIIVLASVTLFLLLLLIFTKL